MRNRVLVLLFLLATACGPGTATPTSPPTSATGSTAATTTASTPTTTASSTTETAAPSTTTTASSTTTTASSNTTTTASSTTTTTEPVAVAGFLPEATSRSLIPWGDVGPGWYVVLYDGSRADPMLEREAYLYLVAPDGTRYQAADWPANERPYGITDVRPDGTAAIVVGDDGTHHRRYELVDLQSGARQALPVPVPPLGVDGPGDPVKFTRPTGRNLVVWSSDGSTEHIDRRTTGWAQLAQVYQQPYSDWDHALRWLYGYDGTTVVVAHSGGMAVVGNDGPPVRDLWVPMGHICEPVRWWDAHTILASCRGQGPAFPHDFYHQLWLLPDDGTAGEPLTNMPAGPIDVVDFGYLDAWSISGDVLLQWAGDCGAASIHVLQSDGTGIPLAVGGVTGDGIQMVGVSDGRIGTYVWQGCDQWVGALEAIGTDGSFLRHLVPTVGDARGVIAAQGLATVYP